MLHIAQFQQNIRASQMLELVHSDICGSLQVQSIGGARYFITSIDDHSNWSVVYHMHKKCEAFHYYKLFANYAQTHSGRKIKVLRSWSISPHSITRVLPATFTDKIAPPRPAMHDTEKRITGISKYTFPAWHLNSKRYEPMAGRS